MQSINIRSVLADKDIVIDAQIVETVINIRLQRSPWIHISLIRFINDRYMALPDCRIWIPQELSPYSDDRLYNTKEEALNTLIEGYQKYYSESIPNELLFWVYPGEASHVSEYTYIDGNGNVVPYREVNDRREVARHESEGTSETSQDFVSFP